MTQDELAKQLGVEQSAVTQWETGKYKPKPRRYADIAAALRCAVSDFCDDEPAPSPAPVPGAAEGLSDEERRLLQTWRTSPEFRLIAAAFQDGSIASRAEQTRQASAIVASAKSAEAKKDAKTVAAGVVFLPTLFGLTLSMVGYSAAAAMGGCLGLALLSAFSLLVWCFVRWRLAARRERRGQ